MFEGYSLKELIGTWLEVTDTLDVQPALSFEEAEARARAVLEGLRQGKLPLEAAGFGDAAKAVCYTLVRLLSESEYASPEKRARDVEAVHRFVEAAWREPDEFGAKGMLLRDCDAVTSSDGSGDVVTTREDGRDTDPRTAWQQNPETLVGRVRKSHDLFEDCADSIHLILRAEYHLSEAQAERLERDLYEWFLRFHTRPGSDLETDYRPLLLSACARLATRYRSEQGSSDRAEAPSEDKLFGSESWGVLRRFPQPEYGED